MYYMDFDEAYREKVKRQLHKNATSYIEQILEAASHKTVAVQTPSSHLKNIRIRRTRHTGHRWRSKDEY